MALFGLIGDVLGVAKKVGGALGIGGGHDRADVEREFAKAKAGDAKALAQLAAWGAAGDAYAASRAQHVVNTAKAQASGKSGGLIGGMLAKAGISGPVTVKRDDPVAAVQNIADDVTGGRPMLFYAGVGLALYFLLRRR